MKRRNMEKYLGLYAELAEIVGEKNVKEIYNRFQGLEVSFPMRLYSPDYVVSLAMENEGKKELREIAREYGYNEKYLKRLMNQKKEKTRRNNL